MTIRENWRHETGPLGLPMPVDAFPSTRDWAHPGPPWPMYREDWLDRLNEDGHWGSDNPAESGGSGITYGRAWEHLDSTLVQIEAMKKSVKPDGEHAYREYTDPFWWWDATHDPKAARLINSIVTRRIAGFNPTGIPHLDYLQPIVEADPHRGMECNGRWLGGLMWGKAMLHKVSRTSSVWSLQALEVCERAAMPGTGQVLIDTHTGIDQDRIFYCFHQSKLAMGAIALAYRIGKPTPNWCIDYALSLHEQTPYGLSAWPSPPSFMYTKGIRLKAATGPEQHPDPAHGDWSSLCVALAKTTADPAWISRAWRFGSGIVANDAQERRDSLLLRGWTSQ